MRRMASAPKGLLRHYVLKLLKEKPMSGAELIREIAEKTESRWKPSPGSVYPLLSWLLDSGYTEEAAEQEAGVKRYSLTEAGEKLLEEHEERRKEHPGGFPFHGMPFPWFDSYPEEAKDVVESLGNLRRMSQILFRRLREDLSADILKELKELIDETTTKLETILEKKSA
ncbi:MAG: PadR family transcriptional regulator [Promethearchaeota archaeon]